MRFLVLVLSLATLVFLGWLFSSGAPRQAAVDVDSRQGAYMDSRRVLARIQSDLDRTAASRRPGQLPVGISGDALEAIVDAYRLFLDGNVKGMDVQLKEIGLVVRERLKAGAAVMTDPDRRTHLLAIFARLDAASASAVPAVRLAAALRMVDGLLFMEAAEWGEADLLTRHAESRPVLNETWLRLPCRTVVGRVGQIRQALEALGELAGPLLSCPSDSGDLGVLEAQAKQPAMLPPRIAPIAARLGLPRFEPGAPPTPWDHETAVAWMDEDPDAAEPVLAAGRGPADKLDYALFLHAFRPAAPEMQANILSLLRGVDAAASYDGGDASLVALLRGAKLPAYAIPCAVLQVRPALLAALQGDGATAPRSGCATGRGAVRGFPEAEVAAYIAAAAEADGHFAARRPAYAVRQQAALEAMKLDPRGLAAGEPPPLDHPYQVWGMTSLAAHAVAEHVAGLYRDAHTKLVAWYLRQGLDADTAAKAAKAGLFKVVFGASCGDGEPRPSLRAMVLEQAPIDDVRAALAAPRDAPEVTACAVHAGIDPLPLVAVQYPRALALLLEQKGAADTRNGFGKTALMTAAQVDAVEAARLLLDKGASVNATTWMQTGEGLAHDGRSALMYAAGSGSLAMVKLLLERGADPHQADTKGRRAIHYLLGFGPVPANARLSPEERAEAARLLF